MNDGRMNDMFKQMEELFLKVDNLTLEIQTQKKAHDKEIKKLKREHQKEIQKLKNELKEKDAKIEKLEQENQKLKTEVARLKNQKNKDSSNSNKPSGTNGFKNVITNRREKSNKKQGGQKGHTGNSLGKEKLEKILNKENIIKNPPIEINKNENNKNSKPYKTTVIDININVTITDYLYYPDENGNFNVPQKHKKHIVYGDNLKALAADLMYESYNSTDATQNIISSITDNSIELPRSTLINWSKEAKEKLVPEIENIEKELLNSYYAHFDESQIKVDGKSFNEVCVSNAKHTRMWAMKCKKHEELEKINFFKSFMGVIVKDGTDLYNGFGIAFSQCISHIQRYLKGIYDFINHKGPKDMAKFLTKYNEYRKELIAKGQDKFEDNEYSQILNEYDEIIREWKKEWMADKNNPSYNDERKLLSRMEESDKEQILYFLKDFKVPATNNQVETDQRNIKIKQKIGKFRSETGAEIYAIIRSCINTYKKHGINVYSALIKAFNDETIIA